MELGLECSVNGFCGFFGVSHFYSFPSQNQMCVCVYQWLKFRRCGMGEGQERSSDFTLRSFSEGEKGITLKQKKPARAPLPHSLNWPGANTLFPGHPSLFSPGVQETALLWVLFTWTCCQQKGSIWNKSSCRSVTELLSIRGEEILSPTENKTRTQRVLTLASLVAYDKDTAFLSAGWEGGTHRSLICALILWAKILKGDRDGCWVMKGWQKGQRVL